uniref:Uncharacterized protein n=1 Tax=Oryza glumipatula TaxID=40148 RepID=A0A0D9ZHV4_9ORYZ
MVFNEADYGFGEAGYVFTLNDDVNIVASAICLRPPVFKHGIQLMLHCVEEPHAAAKCIATGKASESDRPPTVQFMHFRPD